MIGSDSENLSAAKGMRDFDILTGVFILSRPEEEVRLSFWSRYLPSPVYSVSIRCLM